MATTYDFGAREAANSFRDDFGEYTTGRLDRRHKTVELRDDAPDEVKEAAAVESAASREERSGPGQETLLRDERAQIDFSEGRANVPHAQAVKAIMLDAGVSSWIDYYDPTLTVDEHREVAQRAATEFGVDDRPDPGRGPDDEPDEGEQQDLEAT